MFRGLDHIAIVVEDTEEALRVYRDRFGFRVLLSETMDDGSVRLTHLDLGNTQLQLVEPLVKGHPLWDFLGEHGTALHHLCLEVDDLEGAIERGVAMGLEMAEDRPHQGTQGRRAILVLPSSSGEVQFELTGK